MVEPIPHIAQETPTNSQPFDVIMITHNKLELTIMAVDALYCNTKQPFHLIVVDDSEDIITPQYFELIQKERTNITFVHSDVPYKCGNQIFNIGLAHAKSDYVAMVMNSVRVEPEWEIVALALLQQNPQVGLIGLKCLLEDGTIESAGIRMVKWLPSDMGRGSPGHRLCNVYEPDAVQWALAFVRKQATVGNLAEDIFHGFRGWDDIDNCFVLKKAGWKILYCGVGAGYHKFRATRGNNSAEAEKQNQENGERFYKRWGFWEEFQKAIPKHTVHLIPA